MGGKIDSLPITLVPPRKIPVFSNLNLFVSKGYVHIHRLPLRDLPLKHAWPHRSRVRLPCHAHGDTLKHKSPTPVGVRLVVRVYDVLLLAICYAILPPPPARQPGEAGGEE